MAMIMTKTKLPLLLFVLLSLFFLSLTPSLAYEITSSTKDPKRDPQTEYKQCKERCELQRGPPQQVQLCKQRCEEKQHDLYNIDPQQQAYQQCKSRCQQLEKDHQQPCVEGCELIRQRTHGGEEEKRGGRGGDLYNTDPKQQAYQQCKSRCQQLERGHQQPCIEGCELIKQRTHGGEEEKRGGRGGDLFNTDPKQQAYQQCKSRCQQLEEGHQQPCIEGCERIKQRTHGGEEEKRGGRGGDLFNTDPKQQAYQQCKSRCQQLVEGHQKPCIEGCEQIKQRTHGGEEEQHGGGGSDGLYNTDPQKEYQKCQSRCQKKADPRKQQTCQQSCDEKHREHQGEKNQRSEEEEEQKHQQQQQQQENPYYYTKRHFDARYKTSEGYAKILERFSKRSELLAGIENYRFGILKANPNTFVVPNHIDADSVFYVVRGRGAISLVRQNNRETHNLEQGDVMNVPAGAVVYLINRDNNEKLFIAKLIQALSIPGRVETFFGPGGEDPESFYTSFSNDILEAAFNTPWEKLRRLVGQQKRGVIIKASRQQIKALSPDQSLWPFGGGRSGGPYNLLNQRPLHSNNYGQLYQVTPNDFKQLRHLDVAVSFANISKGAMLGPYYNTRATKIAFVVEGNGYVEMACPHVSSPSGGRHQGGSGGGSLQHHEGSSSKGGHYQKISAKLSRGDLYVVPAGHPVVTVASRDQNLQVVCFEINARDNEKNSLVGKNSVLNQIEREAKELAFGVSAEEVEEIFGNQKESFFFPGPKQQQQQEGRAYA